MPSHFLCLPLLEAGRGHEAVLSRAIVESPDSLAASSLQLESEIVTIFPMWLLLEISLLVSIVFVV